MKCRGESFFRCRWNGWRASETAQINWYLVFPRAGSSGRVVDPLIHPSLGVAFPTPATALLMAFFFFLVTA